MNQTIPFSEFWFQILNNSCQQLLPACNRLLSSDFSGIYRHWSERPTACVLFLSMKTYSQSLWQTTWFICQITWSKLSASKTTQKWKLATTTAPFVFSKCREFMALSLLLCQTLISLHSSSNRSLGSQLKKFILTLKKTGLGKTKIWCRRERSRNQSRLWLAIQQSRIKLTSEFN